MKTLVQAIAGKRAMWMWTDSCETLAALHKNTHFLWISWTVR